MRLYRTEAQSVHRVIGLLKSVYQIQGFKRQHSLIMKKDYNKFFILLKTIQIEINFKFNV